jgi:hypothetical protein
MVWLVFLLFFVQQSPAVVNPESPGQHSPAELLCNDHFITELTGAEKEINVSVPGGKTLYGYARSRFSTGDVIYEDKLDDQEMFLKNWVVQQSRADPKLERYARISGGRLHVHDPRGTTIWFRQKLKGPVMISYRVSCPSEYFSGTDIMPRDINQFWMAVDPSNPNPDLPGGLFDTGRYNGSFGTYDALNCYYASTGGGNVTDNNRTVRFRRYPRSMNKKDIPHVALDDKDGKAEFLIEPDREYLVQLVAADDIVQFIFDGKLVYEIQEGDPVAVSNGTEGSKDNGKWGSEPWTIYREGWFGFRMTRTHHVYRDFKVYSLIRK